MQQLFAAILFYTVFTELFIVLSIFIGKTLYDFYKKGKETHTP